MARAQGEHAVVLGASMAGLLAARVLTESFRQVTVIERDVLPTEAGQRRSVPPGRHVHALLSRGAQVLDDLFPALTKQVAEAGAPVGDLLDNVRWFLSGHRLAQADIGQPLLLALLVSDPLPEIRLPGRAGSRRQPRSTIQRWRRLPARSAPGLLAACRVAGRRGAGRRAARAKRAGGGAASHR